mmetsp:Transcript_85739/g.190818  ORF Transcript_85739/g.190818 Transcript_85739/m.190818 type:complete len:308 (+) Transcript_85739:139-1062(+)
MEQLAGVADIAHTHLVDPTTGRQHSPHGPWILEDDPIAQPLVEAPRRQVLSIYHEHHLLEAQDPLGRCLGLQDEAAAYTTTPGPLQYRQVGHVGDRTLLLRSPEGAEHSRRGNQLIEGNLLHADAAGNGAPGLSCHKEQAAAPWAGAIAESQVVVDLLLQPLQLPSGGGPHGRSSSIIAGHEEALHCDASRLEELRARVPRAAQRLDGETASTTTLLLCCLLLLFLLLPPFGTPAPSLLDRGTGHRPGDFGPPTGPGESASTALPPGQELGAGAHSSCRRSRGDEAWPLHLPCSGCPTPRPPRPQHR